MAGLLPPKADFGCIQAGFVGRIRNQACMGDAMLFGMLCGSIKTMFGRKKAIPISKD
jgi:hypothetical protein